MNQENVAKPIRVGVVGLGRAGWKIHLNALRDDERYQALAVVDPDAGRREEAEKEFSVASYSSLDELLAQTPDVQVVVVASPSRFHFADASAVLEAGKHCILEKPMASEIGEAKALVELADKKGTQLLVHHQHAFMPMANHLREVMDRGVLGPIYQVRTFWGSYARRWDWQTLLKNGGGQLSNTCPHTLSVVLPLLDGPATEVVADLRNIKDPGDAEDHVELSLRTASGMTANIVVSSAMAGSAGPQWMLLGKYGALTSDGKISKLRYYDPAEAPALEIIDAAAPGRNYLTEELPWKTEEIPSEPTTSVGKFYDDVAAVLCEGKTPRVTPSSALEVMRVMGLARAAAK